MRLLVLSLLLAGTASAQDTILTPGHPDLDFGDVAIEDAIFNLRILEPEAQSLGYITETATLEGDVLTVVTSTNVQMAGPAQVDSTRMSWPTLEPISHHLMGESKSGAVMFGDNQIAGTFTNGAAEFPFEFDTADAVFPLAAVPYVVRALPLDQTGYEAMIPVFSAESRFKDAMITIVGPETVTVGGNTISAVAVDQVGGGGIAQSFRVRHFVDPNTRDLVHSVIYPPNLEVHWVKMSDADYAAAQAEDAAERAAAAANSIAPGSDVLMEIDPQMVTYEVKVVEPVQQNLGTVTVTETLADGRLTIINDINIPQAGQVQQDTTVYAYPSLEAISRVEVKPDETVRATFTNGRMTSVTTAGGEDTTVEADMEDAFGPSITRFIVRALPFEEGYVTSFRQINSEGDISTSQLRVTGQETHTLSDGSERTVWVVLEEEEGNPDYYYYIDSETRELLKNAFAPQPGVRLEIVVP